MSNTQVHRRATVLNIVCWLQLNTEIQRVWINRKEPYYDLYIYHGNHGRAKNYGPDTEFIVSVNSAAGKRILLDCDDTYFLKTNIINDLAAN